jgi:DNA segregation ATPase FtsK/SpoIIIE-like protein
MALLSGHLGAMLRRRLREFGGIALLSLAMMAALALATWSVHDPSLSHATDARVHNLLGRPGAIAADLMMQLLGLGSLALLLPVGIWGYRLLGHRPLGRERLRVMLWIFGALLTAAFAACLPRGVHWPLPSGLGGVVGDAILRAPAMVLGTPLLGFYRFVLAIILGLAALFTFAGAAGFIWRGAADHEAEEEEDDAPALRFCSVAALARRRLRAARPPRPAASSRGSMAGRICAPKKKPRTKSPAHRRNARRASRDPHRRQNRAAPPVVMRCRRLSC